MRRETAIIFSSHSSVLPACQALTLPSIFHPLPPLSASLSPAPPPGTLIRLHSPIYDFPLSIPLSQCSLSHISLHSSSFLPFTRLVLTSPPPPPSASLSPVSHYIHSQTPVSRLLPLRISSSLSLIRPRLTAYPSLLCSFITFSSQTGLDGHSTW